MKLAESSVLERASVIQHILYKDYLSNLVPTLIYATILKIMKNLGTKILVVGVSASGKSTFTKKLAQKTNFMDAIMWKPGWNYIGDEETVKKLHEVASTENWIIEGYITKQARAFVFERADTIIYLDYSPLVCAWRYVCRWWKHRKTPRPEMPGSPEKFSFKFLKLVWTKGEAISLNKFLAEVTEKKNIIVLKRPKEGNLFLESL
jgi:adenylate kinase family enzyme